MKRTPVRSDAKLSRQSICKISYSQEVDGPAIHSRIQKQIKESPFAVYLRNKMKQLKQRKPSAMDQKKKIIKIFHSENAKTPHDFFTDTTGKKLLSEVIETHDINFKRLRSKSNEGNPFFLQISGQASLMKHCCNMRLNTENDKYSAPKRRFTPQKTTKKIPVELWRELNGWQTVEDKNSFYF